MRVLVLGGTEFVGRHIVEAALALGHEVDVFHRGNHGTDLFPTARHILGDRDGGLVALPDEKWDWTIDTCGYVPRVVQQSVEHLKNRTDRYLFISTISVLKSMAASEQTEGSPLAGLKNPTTETIDAETYGGLKVLCEKVVNAGFGTRGVNIRPGMIVGPYDKTDRYTYWFLRARKGGKMLSMCDRQEPFQFIDGRDLADFCLLALDNELTGEYFATGPESTHTWGNLFDVSANLAGNQYEIVMPTVEWLEERGINPQASFPAQIRINPDAAGAYRIDCRKAIRAGLKFMPIEETISDTVKWRDTVPEPLKVGLDPAVEERLLAELE